MRCDLAVAPWCSFLLAGRVPSDVSRLKPLNPGPESASRYKPFFTGSPATTRMLGVIAARLSPHSGSQPMPMHPRRPIVLPNPLRRVAMLIGALPLLAAGRPGGLRQRDRTGDLADHLARRPDVRAQQRKRILASTRFHRRRHHEHQRDGRTALLLRSGNQKLQHAGQRSDCERRWLVLGGGQAGIAALKDRVCCAPFRLATKNPIRRPPIRRSGRPVQRPPCSRLSVSNSTRKTASITTTNSKLTHLPAILDIESVGDCGLDYSRLFAQDSLLPSDPSVLLQRRAPRTGQSSVGIIHPLRAADRWRQRIQPRGRGLRQ